MSELPSPDKTHRPAATSAQDPRELARSPRLSFWTRPLMWLHRLVSNDARQHQAWRQRVEAIEQAEAIDLEPSTEGKAILSNQQAYRQMRVTSLVSASGMMGLGAVWMAALIPLYAVGHGFGWIAASAYLLPVPIAWRVGRKMWDQASLQSMKELGTKPSAHQRLKTLSASMVRGMAAGAGMGFTLVFLQALLSWFMTPAPTLGLELIWDLFHGTLGASVGAMAGAVFGPLAARPAPALTGSETSGSSPALGSGDRLQLSSGADS